MKKLITLSALAIVTTLSGCSMTPEQGHALAAALKGYSQQEQHRRDEEMRQLERANNNNGFHTYRMNGRTVTCSTMGNYTTCR